MTNSQIRNSMPGFRNKVKANSTIIIIGVLIFFCCVIVLGVLGIYDYANSIRGIAVAEQQRLSTLFSEEQVTHADLVMNATNRYNIYFVNTDALTGIMEQTIGGSFNDTYKEDGPVGTYQKGDPVPGQINGGFMINALAQAYPDMAMSELTEIAGKMMDGAVADQIAYSNDQKTRLDAARSFNVWRREDIFRLK